MFVSMTLTILAGCAMSSSDYMLNKMSKNDRTGAIGRNLAEQLSQELKYKADIDRIVILPLKISTQASSGYWHELNASRYEVSLMLRDTLPDSIRTELFRIGRYEIVADRDMNRAIKQLFIEKDLHSEGRYLDQEEMTQLGSMLNAQAILGGQITRSDNNLRVALELIDIGTGRVVAVAQSLYP
jgi:hypothetical protein